jgi:hypothetical protein
MEDRERIIKALEQTKILKYPDKLISTFGSTTLHYYVLVEPYYLEALKNEGPETKIREGIISWDKPKLLTPEYILNMEGFSDEARKAMELLARQIPDLAGFIYKMSYKKESVREHTVSKSIESTFDRIKDELKDNGNTLTVVIKGIDELWDVSLMKFIQGLLIKSAYSLQIPYYLERGFLRSGEKGFPLVTRNLEGLPIVAHEEIERMFGEVMKGNLDPVVLKKELDSWGVFKAYEDRFFDLFRD